MYISIYISPSAQIIPEFSELERGFCLRPVHSLADIGFGDFLCVSIVLFAFNVVF